MGHFLVFLWLSHFFMDFCTGIFPIYKTLAGFDLTQAALIAGVSGFIGEICQLFFGRYGDRGQRKKMILIGITLASSALLLPLFHSLTASWVIVGLVMIGSGCFHPCAAGIAGLSHAKSRSHYLSLFSSGGAAGLAISQVAFAAIYGFHPMMSLLFLIPISLVIYSTYKYPFHDPVVIERNSGLFEILFKRVLKMKSLLSLYGAQVCNYGFMFALIFYLPDALKAKSAPDWLWMGSGHLLLISGSSCGLLFSFFIFFLFTPSFSPLVLALLLFIVGACFGSLNPLCVSWGIKIAPEYPSTVSSFLMGFAWGVANLLTALTGVVNRLMHIESSLTPLFIITGVFCLFFPFVRATSLAIEREKPVQDIAS